VETWFPSELVMNMRVRSTILAASAILGLLVLTPAFAREGGNGGDREPAGGAFMSSYPEQGSTGIQRGGPPRSADVPRYYGSPDFPGTARQYRERFPAR
jgi:hypothetical protein